MYSYATLGSNDLKASKKFFDATLGTIGVTCFYDADDGLAYSETGTQRPSLWVVPPFNGNAATFGNGAMLSFIAKSVEAVNAFHAAALANGGSDEGAPGYRENYSPDFYAAYVRDPLGNKLCAVFRDPARAVKK
jgi:catechol 2,3-dioxygenase-like lactoylglutathione lyase family enzyme